MKNFTIRREELDDALERLFDKCAEKGAMFMVFPTQSLIHVVQDDETIAEISVVSIIDSYEVADEIFPKEKKEDQQ